MLVGGVGALLQTTTIDGSYTVIVWTSVTGVTGNDTWTPNGVNQAAVLAIGGGGGGGGVYGGGGGGGGYFYKPLLTVSSSLTIIVGNGGAGGISSGGQPGTAGGDSSVNNGSLYSAKGGGYGQGTYSGTGGAGGSGGGASSSNTGAKAGGASTQTVGTPQTGWGTAGGTGGTGSVAGKITGAGGGGAGHAGYDGSESAGGNGGEGKTSDITGSTVTYAGGGGGCGDGRGTPSTPGVHVGAGGGGDGGSNSVPTAGTNGLGGGGGGGGTSSGSVETAGAAGGSGIVIIRYLTPSVPVASFTSANISVATNVSSQEIRGISPLIVQFADTSTETPTSWAWARKNLTATTWTVFNTTANPVQSFVTGNWSVNLSATNAQGTGISAQTLWVNVSSGVSKPIAVSSLSRSTMPVGSYAFFNDTSLNTPTAWCWTFAPGYYAAVANGTVYYYQRGIFNGSSNVSNSAGFNLSYNIIRII